MTDLRALVTRYIEANAEEELTQLQEFLAETDGNDKLVDPTNYVGHITASGLVISKKRRKTLLIHHRLLDMDLQPGTQFYDGLAPPLEVAQRAVFQETGITGIEVVSLHIDEQIPLDIDTHYIPEIPHEPSHFHHDFRYLFVLTEAEDGLSDDELMEKEGTENKKWVDIRKLARQNTFSRVLLKIQNAFSTEFRPRRFFNTIAKRVLHCGPLETIVVAHLIPDVPPFLAALNAVAPIKAVVPKPKSVSPEVQRRLIEQCCLPVTGLTRDVIKDRPESILEFVRDSDKRVVLLDVGGYFSSITTNLAELCPEKVIGIIEDTENGHQKYKKLDNLGALHLPILSVARSPLKGCEDFLVGQSVLFSADALLRELGILFQYLNCAVLGYGKIGRSIAHHLLLRGVRPAVHDTNPLRLIESINNHCSAPGRDALLRNADVLFCATGSQSLDISAFRSLKPGCFVFSVTSSDDEMNLTFLREYQQTPVAPHITRFANLHNHFYLVNKGNAVNFLHHAVLGDFIHLVRAEMMRAICVLAMQNLKPGLHEMPEEERQQIAEEWLKIFNRVLTGYEPYN